jgi:hypothetical protein
VNMWPSSLAMQETKHKVHVLEVSPVHWDEMQ